MTADVKSIEDSSIGREPTADDLTPAGLPGGDTKTTAEALKELRRTFPDMPLAQRVAALAILTRS